MDESIEVGPFLQDLLKMIGEKQKAYWEYITLRYAFEHSFIVLLEFFPVLLLL